jgi:N-acetylneuraminic acid mutarotase/Tfp pilus assembly protein PilE
MIPGKYAFAEDTATWETKASMTSPHCLFGTEVIDGKIYAIGGTNGASCIKTTEVYDPTANTWTLLAPMSTARSRFQTEVIDGKIYVIGGYESSVLSSVEVYDPSTNIWTTLASMSTARHFFQTEVINGKIYAIGGSGIKTAEVYDPSTNAWTPIASMSVARISFQAEVIDNKIYVMGGSGTATGEVYDPSTNAWTSLASMSTIRYNFQTEVIDGKIYAIGGDNGSSYLNSVEVYDPSTNVWTTLASMPTARQYFRSEAINGKIYVMCGSNASSRLLSAEVYEIATNTWSTIESLSIARQYLQSEVLNGKIYALGGHSDITAYTIVETYTVTSDVTSSPTNLTAIAGNAQTTLSWIAVSGSGVSYSIKRAETSGGIYTTIAPGVTPTEYTDTSVTNGVTYYYVVSAVDSSGSESSDSNEASATPQAEIIDAPSNLNATAGDAQVFLTWNAVDGATNYNIKYSITNGGPYTTITSASTTFTHTGLTNNVTYYYVVSAVTSDGESANSVEVSATPASTATETGNAILTIYLSNQTARLYDLTTDELNDFLTWYDNKAEGIGSIRYGFNVAAKSSAYISSTEYVIFDQIVAFNIDEYSAE